MDTSDKVSIDLLLADILSFVDDESTREHGYNKGYYISGIQKAVEELAYDTFFVVETKDIRLLSEHKKTLALDMPRDAFNVREMYLFNCGCDETEQADPNIEELCGCCTPTSSVIVHWKRLYNNNRRGSGYTAKRVDRGRHRADPIFGSANHHNGNNRHVSTDSEISDSLYYGNIQNGVIMLSSNMRGFSHLRLVYNGTGGSVGDEPVIPRFLRTVIVDYVVERTLRALKVKDRARWRVLWGDANEKLNNEKIGSWVVAERRIKALDTWKRDTMREYTGRSNH